MSVNKGELILKISSQSILKKFEKPEQLSAASGVTGNEQLTQIAVAIAAVQRHINK